jgi:diguanylate cyclase (GGDEF)-like protein
MNQAPDASPSPWFATLGGEGVARLLSLAMESMGVSMSVKQISNGQYVQASAALDRLFERTESSLVGSSDNELMRPDEAAAMRRVELQVMGLTAPQVHEHRLDLGGRRREFTLVRLPLDERYMLALWMERSAERQREAQLQKALVQIEQHQSELAQARQQSQGSAGRDEVSGLQQRSLFDELLQREIDLSTREHREFALVMISIDTPSGAAHPMQREALGRLLRGNTRAMDAASHMGDDRFGVLLSGVGLATAHSRMEHLRRQCMQQLVVVDGKDLGLAVSMGVASFPHSAGSHDDLLASSSAALQQAQRRGQNQVALAAISLV